jgi:processive 1,2-diacylglycerol beta-glucosyltransferase
MKKRIMILSASVGSGHVKAAEALEKAFLRHPHVQEVFCDDSLDHTNILHKQFYSALYKRLSEVTPQFLGWWYETSDEPWVSDKVRLALDLPQSLPLVNLIKDFQPDSIICTHFMPAGVISHLVGRGQIDAELSIVVTDFHFHAMWITRAFHHYFVSQEEDKIHMAALGLAAERITVSGIPVDPAFADPIDEAEVRRDFGFDPELPILLVNGGTLGLSPASAVVRRLLKLDHDFQAVVCCGRNEELRAEVESLVRGKPQFRVLGYADRMRDLMGISTLLLSKPGGLTTAEALACGLPMVILDPIGGQEERNSDVLLENGAAVKCTEVTVLNHKVGKLLDQPALLYEMSVRAKRLGRPNAARTVVDTIMSHPQREPEMISRKDEKKLRKAIGS